MENKQVIKNMEYWKKKNNIPGIEALHMAGLTDGRAGSSAFQMAEPGSSPNKGLGGFLKKLNPINHMKKIGGIGKSLIKGDFKGAVGQMNPFGGGGGNDLLSKVQGGGGGGDDASAGAELLKEEAKAEMAGDSAVAMRKSPLEQEETMMEEKPVNPTERIYVNYISDSKGDTYKEGDLISEDDLEASFKKTGNDAKDYPQLSVADYSEVREDENGLYVQKLREGEEIKGLEYETKNNRVITDGVDGGGQ